MDEQSIALLQPLCSRIGEGSKVHVTLGFYAYTGDPQEENFLHRGQVQRIIAVLTMDIHP